MDGDTERGSGSTPGPGIATGSGTPPTPGSGAPTSPPDLETEWLGLAVDSPEQGGLNPHVAYPGGVAPSSATPATVDDVAAYLGLLELSQAGDPKPAFGPVGSTRRLRTTTVATMLFGGSILLILAVLAVRPGGIPATGAGGVEAPAVEEARPGAGGDGEDAEPGGAQPVGVVIPASCLVPEGGALDLELTDVSWNQEEDGLNASWDVLVHNRDTETFTVFLHRNADANAATRANKWVGPPVDWDVEGYYLVAPDPEAPAINSWSGGVRTSVEPGLPTFCSWESVDRLVAVYYRPECSADVWTQLKAAPDAAAREALMAPLAIDMPIPDEMRTFSCPP